MPVESDTAIRQVPDAVIEVISRGFEKKDLEVGIPVYLSQGIKDVVVLDPYNLEVTHARAESVQKSRSPTVIQLECGCICTV